MAVRATLQNGSKVMLATDRDAKTLIKEHSSQVLTGSADFLHDVWFETDTGGIIRGNAVTMLEDVDPEDVNRPS